MTANIFGGRWTLDKLQVLQEYLAFYTTALSRQPLAARPFNLVYLDAFAGTGRCGIRSHGPQPQVIPGSATLALRNAPPFAAYHFIEPKPRHLRELQALVQADPLAARCQVHRGTAQGELPGILARYDWRSHRGVLFLDPFGLQCDWATLQMVQATQALDVIFLLSVSGLFRNAPVAEADIGPDKAQALTRVLGTEDWRTAWYTNRQPDLFGGQHVSRDRGWQQMVDFATRRLQSLFPLVLPPRLLGDAGGPPLFALYLAVSNPSGAARKLAQDVGRHILNKLR